MEPETINARIDAALEELEAETPDSPVPNVVELQSSASREVLAAAISLCGSDEPLRRELGARILRELGPEEPGGTRPFSAEAVPVLLGMLRSEQVAAVTRTVLQALAFNGATGSLPEFLVRVASPDRGIRVTVAFQLPGLATPQTMYEVVGALKVMTTDPDADVRYYAMYALCEPEEALSLSVEERRQVVSRLADDPDPQIREYAREFLDARPLQ